MDIFIPWSVLENYNFKNIFWKIDNNLLISNYIPIYKTQFFCFKRKLHLHRIEILWIHDKIEDIFFDLTNSILYIYLNKKERPEHIPKDKFEYILIEHNNSPYGLHIVYI